LSQSSPRSRRGITVLTLLLIIIAVVIAAFFLVSYLRTRPAPVQSSSAAPQLMTTASTV
jgi:hypothetical protein